MTYDTAKRVVDGPGHACEDYMHDFEDCGSRMHASAEYDQRADAYALLGIKPGVTYTTARRCYRRAAFKKHPDHGGDVARMAAINNAWELVRRDYGK